MVQLVRASPQSPKGCGFNPRVQHKGRQLIDVSPTLVMVLSLSPPTPHLPLSLKSTLKNVSSGEDFFKKLNKPLVGFMTQGCLSEVPGSHLFEMQTSRQTAPLAPSFGGKVGA